MLTNTYKPGEILVFKLPTGEEVLARLQSEDMTNYVVNKPATIQIVDAGDGNIGLDLQPSLFAMDINTTVKISKASVVMVTKARQDLQDAYLQSTGGVKIVGADALNGLQSSS